MAIRFHDSVCNCPHVQNYLAKDSHAATTCSIQVLEELTPFILWNAKHKGILITDEDSGFKYTVELGQHGIKSAVLMKCSKCRRVREKVLKRVDHETYIIQGVSVIKSQLYNAARDYAINIEAYEPRKCNCQHFAWFCLSFLVNYPRSDPNILVETASGNWKRAVPLLCYLVPPSNGPIPQAVIKLSEIRNQQPDKPLDNILPEFNQIGLDDMNLSDSSDPLNAEEAAAANLIFTTKIETITSMRFDSFITDYVEAAFPNHDSPSGSGKGRRLMNQDHAIGAPVRSLTEEIKVALRANNPFLRSLLQLLVLEHRAIPYTMSVSFQVKRIRDSRPFTVPATHKPGKPGKPLSPAKTENNCFEGNVYYLKVCLQTPSWPSPTDFHCISRAENRFDGPQNEHSIRGYRECVAAFHLSEHCESLIVKHRMTCVAADRRFESMMLQVCFPTEDGVDPHKEVD